MKRKHTVLFTIGILLLAVISSVVFAKMKEAPERRMNVEHKINVPVIEVKNQKLNLTIPVVGRLIAKDKIEIYSEVGGIMKSNKKDFLEGIHYRKGDLMININSEEAENSLKSRKSDLMNLVSNILPDLKFDYPESYTQWLEYLNAFDVSNKIVELPKPVDSREKFYISGKGIYKSFYDIVSLETRLEKYKIYAPFDGVITACSIKPGTLVRAGQKLGEYVKESEYELAVSLSIKEVSLVEVGDVVTLTSDELRKSWRGKVSRMNSTINSKTQTVMAYVSVSSKELKEGMFLNAQIQSKKSVVGIVLNRKLLQEDNMVYIIEDSTVKEKPIRIIQQKSDVVIVEGLTDGTILSTKTKNLHAGLEVRISL